MDQNSRLLKIAVFYDGNYFFHVSNYYRYTHARQTRLSIHGLHEFVRCLVSARENVDEKLCQIVDCHYFRGRLPALEAKNRNLLFNERVFDDILMREGVVTHYLPTNHGMEKGVDLSLALEALELTIFKKFNIIVLIASDGDYVPLARKLNALGTRVVVLGWDFEFQDDNGAARYTCTSNRLMNEVSYPIRMHDIIDGKADSCGFSVDNLFMLPTVGNAVDNLSDDEAYEEKSESREPMFVGDPANTGAGRRRGQITQLKNGYGFIKTGSADDRDLYFYRDDLVNCDFSDLSFGDIVEFEIGANERGECARKITLA